MAANKSSAGLLSLWLYRMLNADSWHKKSGKENNPSILSHRTFGENSFKRGITSNAAMVPRQTLMLSPILGSAWSTVFAKTNAASKTPKMQANNLRNEKSLRFIRIPLTKVNKTPNMPS